MTLLHNQPRYGYANLSRTIAVQHQILWHTMRLFAHTRKNSCRDSPSHKFSMIDFYAHDRDLPTVKQQVGIHRHMLHQSGHRTQKRQSGQQPRRPSSPCVLEHCATIAHKHRLNPRRQRHADQKNTSACRTQLARSIISDDSFGALMLIH